MTYEFRTAVPGDWDEIARVLANAFNDEFDETVATAEGVVFEPDRTVVATSDGVIAGCSSAFTRDLSVPGAVIPASHVTMVSVGATHRRQGLLTRMITELHTDAAARDEAVAVLWASEGKIYQRYGYGLAARRAEISGRSSDVSWLKPDFVDTGRLRAVPADSADELRGVYEAVRADRVGWSSRDDRWWEHILSDPAPLRRGATGARTVVHEDVTGIVDGYLTWRVKADWPGDGPNGTVVVRELVASTPIAYRALWQFVLSVDLTRNFQHSFVAIDEPLQFLVTVRRLQAKFSDALWIRILDVPKALEARRYAAPIDVVISVEDARTLANTGRSHLIGSADKAVCTATDEPADLAMSINELGSAYLGGTSLAALAASDRVRELRPGTLTAASIAFGWQREPSAIEIF